LASLLAQGTIVLTLVEGDVMTTSLPEFIRSDDLRQLLLELLRRPRTGFWPGADGLTLEEVLSSYPQAAAAGCVPDCEELLSGHPEWRAELSEFFTAAAPAPADSRTL
jgi:hypothetical protein